MTTVNALLRATAAFALTGAGGCATGDQELSIGDLRDTTVEVQRDGTVSNYPRRVGVVIPLPVLSGGCASLDPAVTVTLDGQPPFEGLYRGGVSPTPGFFGGIACEGRASAAFFLSDQAGPRVMRFTQGDRTAEIVFHVPGLEKIELTAPTNGHAHPGDLLTVRVPQSFYDSLAAAHPMPSEIGWPAIVRDAVYFRYGLFRDAGTPLEDFNAGVLSSVGVAIDDVTVPVRVPTYATAGVKRFYLTFGFSGDWSPMAVDRCAGFGGCTGTVRDNAGVLGPIDLTVDGNAAP